MHLQSSVKSYTAKYLNTRRHRRLSQECTSSWKVDLSLLAKPCLNLNPPLRALLCLHKCGRCAHECNLIPYTLSVTQHCNQQCASQLDLVQSHNRLTSPTRNPVPVSRPCPVQLPIRVCVRQACVLFRCKPARRLSKRSMQLKLRA